MGKYKKKIRAEKAKVKLRKKKLPKGQNITDTSFKVKKIVTVEQLRKVNENEPVSSWNVPLKDLLIHLGHPNKSTRLNGLNGIKEVVVNYPRVLTGPSLKSTVMKVLECMADLEKKVRTTAVSLMDTIFTHLKETQIVTFHELLNIHLACIMTHRNVEIQKDSLKLTDIIVKHAPDAIRKNFKIIMTNFIRILSSYKYGAQSEILLKKGSKKDLEENRIAILQRLSKILLICYPFPSKEYEDKLVVSAKNAKGFSKRLFTRHLSKVPDLSEIFRPQGKMFNKEAFDNFEDDFKLLVSQVMPLLFDSWAEFSPQTKNNGFFEECVVKESTAKLLALIIEIIMMLYDRSLNMERDDVRNLFCSSYSNQIAKLFLSSFPYTPKVLDQDFRDIELNGLSALSYSRSYLSQNLSICYLAYHMRLKISNQVKSVLDHYVLNALQVRNTKCEEILSKIVEFIAVNQTKHRKNDSLLKAAVRAYKATTNFEFQNRLQIILCNAASCNGTSNSGENDWITDWMLHLVKQLSGDKIHMNLLSTLLKIIQGNKRHIILKKIEKNFSLILKNVPKIKVDECDLLLGRKKIINILYWCESSVIRDSLTSGILDVDEYPDDMRNYARMMFNLKLQGTTL